MHTRVPRAQKDIPLDNIDSVLLSNECTVCKVYSIWESRGISEKGVVCVTNHRILFIGSRKQSNITSLRSSRGLETGACILERIPLGMIDRITENTQVTQGSSPYLSIVCKDGRAGNFIVGYVEDVERLYHHLCMFSFPSSISKLFAFYNQPNKSARKIIDLYPNEKESDDEDESLKLPFLPKVESSEDLSSGIVSETETETETEMELDEFDADFLMYDGWDIFHPKREYLRLGVRVNGYEKRKKLPRILREQLKEDKMNSANSPLFRSQWRLSKVNFEYELCESYPRYIAVPRLITDTELMNAKGLRNLDRIPILSFIHPDTYASICHSSQLFVGFHGPRNNYDEKLVESIQSNGLNPNASLVFLDCRPPNPSRGGRGTENMKYYLKCTYDYLSISCTKKFRQAQFHVFELMRECQCLVNQYSRAEQKTVAVIDALRDNRCITWIKKIQSIITGSIHVVNLVQQGSSVIIHCPYGRDRSPLVISLAMLQLDPYYRTIEGFEVLIEKEWNAAGHEFQTRCGHGVQYSSDNERAPIFIVFLDCVWQFLQQHPDSFEFNEEVSNINNTIIRHYNNIQYIIVPSFLGRKFV